MLFSGFVYALGLCPIIDYFVSEVSPTRAEVSVAVGILCYSHMDSFLCFNRDIAVESKPRWIHSTGNTLVGFLCGYSWRDILE